MKLQTVYVLTLHDIAVDWPGGWPDAGTQSWPTPAAVFAAPGAAPPQGELVIWALAESAAHV